MLHKTLVIFLLLFFILKINSQEDNAYRYHKNDTTEYLYMIIDGDTLPRQFIDLEEVYLLNKLKFNSAKERRAYLILRRRTRKVYPYAKLAAERLQVMTDRLATLESNREKRIYTKRVQKYIEGEFTDELKKLTKSEGKILVKLIHRQTGTTAYDLVKELRTGWRAFWYNTTASLFEISLKDEFSPLKNKEDFLIEDILQRAFQEGALEVQHPAWPIDYFELADFWTNK
ncbi:DUF4294 domain-containing protein [Planktosalinus lacus]|uniref:DUF4294 domain-containing protein n=1 Tax=Planktosalinus lacus TaxID=1526573 RepID=A0A8J2VE52_9FLAO|nr:DUF4294 domain-containing protein [Planktosalinus lacus]GGE00019.1 hypothetical protein GCM10011312_24360 [Planktosalinus lacus]